MNNLKKGIAAISAAVIFAGSIGCSSVSGAARRVSDAYIDALLAIDTAAADALCIDGNSTLSDYIDLEYKTRAVSCILGLTHYRFEASQSGNGEDGTLVATYTLVMPNVNAAIEAAPSDYDEFVENLNTMGKSDVSVSVVLKKCHEFRRDRTESVRFSILPGI